MELYSTRLLQVLILKIYPMQIASTLYENKGKKRVNLTFRLHVVIVYTLHKDSANSVTTHANNLSRRVPVSYELAKATTTRLWGGGEEELVSVVSISKFYVQYLSRVNGHF